VQKTKSGLYTRAGRADRAEAGDIRGITLILRDWFSGFADDTKGRQRLIGCPLGLLILLSPPPSPPTLACSSPHHTLSHSLSLPSLSLHHVLHRVPNTNINIHIYIVLSSLSPDAVCPSVHPSDRISPAARSRAPRPVGRRR